MQDNTELLNKIYSCMLDMQKEIRELRREMDEKIRESEERMKAYTNEKVSFLASKLKATEGQIKDDLNESITTLRVILEDEMDHLQVTIKRPQSLSIAEEQAVYNVQE